MYTAMAEFLIGISSSIYFILLPIYDKLCKIIALFSYLKYNSIVKGKG